MGSLSAQLASCFGTSPGQTGLILSSQYVSMYVKDAVDGIIPGAYGPRLLSNARRDQSI